MYVTLFESIIQKVVCINNLLQTTDTNIIMQIINALQTRLNTFTSRRRQTHNPNEYEICCQNLSNEMSINTLVLYDLSLKNIQ